MVRAAKPWKRCGMTIADISGLEASIEVLIKEQVAQYEAQLRQALAGRLTQAAAGAPKRAPKPKGAARRSSEPKKVYRSSEEMAALGRRFLEQVEATPGEEMVVLSAKLGVRSRQLERPVRALRGEGRLRTVGQGSRTRYYAVGAAPTSG